MAPSIAALVALGVRELWVRRTPVAHGVLMALVSVTTVYGVLTLRNNATSTAYVVLAGLLGVLALGALFARSVGSRSRRLLPAAALVVALAIAAPLADFGTRTSATAHSGSIPDAVSTSTRSGGFGGGGQGGGPGGDGSGAASQITAWVTSNYTATTIGGTTVYDLTS